MNINRFQLPAIERPPKSRGVRPNEIDAEIDAFMEEQQTAQYKAEINAPQTQK